MNNTFYLNINKRAYEAIQNKSKTVKVRANKSEINKMRVDNNIVFSNCESNEKMRCKILRIALYGNVRELLLKEDLEKTLSSGKNLEQGILSMESIPRYKEVIANNGVFAIELCYKF